MWAPTTRVRYFQSCGRKIIIRTYLQGYESVDGLWLYLTNANVIGGGQVVLTGPSFVDASNVDKVAQYAQRGTR